MFGLILILLSLVLCRRKKIRRRGGDASGNQNWDEKGFPLLLPETNIIR